MLSRFIKFILTVLVLAALALIGFAYLGDLSPDQSEMRQQVTIDVN